MRKIIFALSIIAIALTACKKAETLEGPNRLFRPVLKQDLQSDGNWIAVSWQPIKGAASYTVQLSHDTFATIDLSETVDTSYYVFEGLKWEQLYQVQVKANAEDTSNNSKFSDLGAIKTARFPTILNVPGIAEISDNAVKVSWATAGAAVTDIKILKASDSSVAKSVTLSGADVTNEYRIVSGLTASTDYIIFLYSGSTVRGWANFTTKASLSGTVIDLRDIEGDPLVLADTLADVPSGSTILLKRGATYTISGNLLDRSLTIQSGTDLLVPDQAVINIVSNFDIVSGSTIDYISFRDVKLITDDYANKYVFNISQSCNIGKISFEACHAEIMRGVVRVKGASAIIDSFVIDKSIIDSVSGYGVLNIDNTSSKANNIVFTHSTIYKTEKFITSKNNSNSLVIENCTINESPNGGNYMIEYSTSSANNVTMPIAIRNCILGIGKSNSGNRTVKGYKVGASTTFDVSGTYTTNDRTSSSELPNLVPYTRSSTELWQDPFNGDFTIVDGLFPGKNSAGDPRWAP